MLFLLHGTKSLFTMIQTQHTICEPEPDRTVLLSSIYVSTRGKSIRYSALGFFCNPSLYGLMN